VVYYRVVECIYFIGEHFRIYATAKPHQMTPIAMARTEDPKLSFCGMSGLWKNWPAFRVPSPMRVAVTAIVAIVPKA